MKTLTILIPWSNHLPPQFPTFLHFITCFYPQILPFFCEDMKKPELAFELHNITWNVQSKIGSWSSAENK